MMDLGAVLSRTPTAWKPNKTLVEDMAELSWLALLARATYGLFMKRSSLFQHRALPFCVVRLRTTPGLQHLAQSIEPLRCHRAHRLQHPHPPCGRLCA